MDYGLNKTSSNYKPNQPFGGIATGNTANSAIPSFTQTSSMTSYKKGNASPNASYTRTNPDGTTQTIQGYNNSNLPNQTMGSGTNNSSLTDSYANALKSQQGATAAAQSLSGYAAPDSNEQKSALPGFDFSKMNPDQQKAFTSFMSGLFGINQGQTQAGLGQVGETTPVTTPALKPNDPTRQQNDPFAITSASRNLF